MFLLYTAVVPVVFAVLLLAVYFTMPRSNRNGNVSGFIVWMYVFLFFACVFVALSFVSTMDSYSEQISDIEDIRKFENITVIYEKRAEALTLEFKKVAENYLGHEKAVFNNMSPNDVLLYMVKYPELKSSENIMQLVEQIRSMQDKVYEQRVEVEKKKKDIRYRLRNPWIFYWLIPER